MATDMERDALWSPHRADGGMDVGKTNTKIRKYSTTSLSNWSPNKQPNPTDTLCPTLLRQNLSHHISAGLSKPKISPAVVVGQALVVEAEQVKHGGMPVTNVNGVFNRLPTPISSVAP